MYVRGLLSLSSKLFHKIQDTRETTTMVVLHFLLLNAIFVLPFADGFAINYRFNTVVNDVKVGQHSFSPVAARLERRSRSVVVQSKNLESDSVQHDLDHLDLESRFGRWKFLQSILEDETDDYRDVDRVLYLVLNSFVENPRPKELSDGTATASPRLTNDQTSLIIEQLFESDENGEKKIQVLSLEDGDFTEKLDTLEQLQPDPIDDEDAFKSCWDLVMEMYGRESTRLSEQSGDRGWKARSSVVRLLIHFDFLNNGFDWEEKS